MRLDNALCQNLESWWFSCGSCLWVSSPQNWGQIRKEACQYCSCALTTTWQWPRWCSGPLLGWWWKCGQNVQSSSVQSLSHIQLSATPWIAARQASLSITNSQSSCKLMSIELVMPSSHLILCHPLLLLPPIPPSIWVFSNESSLPMRWLKYWSFSFSISPSNEHPGLIFFRMDWWISLQSKGLSRVFSNTTVQKHQFFGSVGGMLAHSNWHTGGHLESERVLTRQGRDSHRGNLCKSET